MFAKKLSSLLVALCVALSAFITVSLISSQQVHAAGGTTYYINNQSSGCSDYGAGTSQDSPWCDFTPVQNVTFGPGDQLLLARGDTWNQQLTINGSGSSSNYATLDAYGSGSNPKIIRNSNASDRAVRMTNPSYWNINNLELGSAGAGILVYFTTLGNQGLNFNNIYVHDIYGIHHQNISGELGCDTGSAGAANDFIWNSAGIEFTGNVTSIPSGQYVVQNMQMSNIEGAHNQDSVSIDWCNGGTGNASNVFLSNLNLHDDNGDGNAQGCDEGIRLDNITNLTMIDSTLNDEAACYSSTGTAAIYTAGLNNATIANTIIENTPNTSSPDQTGQDFEGFNNQVNLRDDYFANNAGAGLEDLTIHSGGNNTNLDISGNTFRNNGTANNGEYIGGIKHLGTSASTSGTIESNLFYEPTGFTNGDFSSFTLTNNLQATSDSAIYNAAVGFSGTQGQNQWSYQYSNDGSSWNSFPYNAAANTWQDTSKPGGVPFIQQFDQHPDASCTACWVGRTWTAPSAGTVSIRGRAFKADTTGGDGVIARITKNGSVIWGPQSIVYNDLSGFDANLDNVVVNAGDVLRFEVNNGGSGNNAYDLTSWVPSVAYTSNSTTGDTAFNRYYNGSIPDHWVTTGSVTSGYSREATLGYLLNASQSGMQQVYGCQINQDHFVSLQSNCEGYTELRTEGWIYTNAPSGVATTALYRCYTGSDHFVSTDSNCEGQRTEFLIGYALTNA